MAAPARPENMGDAQLADALVAAASLGDAAIRTIMVGGGVVVVARGAHAQCLAEWALHHTADPPKKARPPWPPQESDPCR